MLWNPLEANLPLYPFFINLWSWAFGISELSLVLPSLIAGTLAVVAIYLLASKLYSSFEGLVSAILFAVLSAPIYFSQEVRCYSFILLLVTLNLYFWFSKKNIQWVVTSILLSWTHYFGILFVGLIILMELLKERKSTKSHLIFLIGLIPLIPLILFQLQHGPMIYPDLSLGEVLSLPLWIFASGLSSVTIILCFLLLSKILLIVFWKDCRKNHEVELLYLVAMPIVLTLLVHFVIKPLWEERYLIIVFPPALLLVSRSLSVLRSWSPKTVLVLTLGLVSLATVGAMVDEGKLSKSYPKLNESLDFIAHSSTCDKNLLVQPQNQKLWGYYLSRYKQLNLIFDNGRLKNQTFWLISMDISDENVHKEQAAYAAKHKVILKHLIDETEAVCFMAP